MITHEIEEVRSGGQNGADLAGVAAAKVVGIRTAGWMPRGWVTLDGPRPQYADFFGMREFLGQGGYPPRTSANVRDSDATIRFAADFDSPGEKCTLRAIKGMGKPYLDVPATMAPAHATEYVTHWIVQHGFRRINVAGNTRRTVPAIERFVYHTLVAVFIECGYRVVDTQLHDHCNNAFERNYHPCTQM